jgi:hypothetical protein
MISIVSSTGATIFTSRDLEDVFHVAAVDNVEVSVGDIPKRQ